MRMVCVIEKLNSLRKSETNTLDFELKSLELKGAFGFLKIKIKTMVAENTKAGKVKPKKMRIRVELWFYRGKKKRVGVIVGIILL